MPLSNVLSKISWRAPGNQWPLIGLPVGDVSPGDQPTLTGDGGADIEIVLTGQIVLAAADFIL
ncbi:MAG TPA: hypothetical protein VK614_04060 [Allosphingosinicella sp.]|nr:hypothetical protein [Allosphingosinicella sp.]